jgi:hypothetical protein
LKKIFLIYNIIKFFNIYNFIKLNYFKKNYINLFIRKFNNKIYLLNLVCNKLFIIFYNYIMKKIFNIFFSKDLFDNFKKIIFFEFCESGYCAPKAGA